MKTLLQLEQLAPYLPYGLKVQYEGIINGNELSKHYAKNKQKNGSFDMSYKSLEQIKGLKNGYIKKVEFWKNGSVYFLGIKSMGLKPFHKIEFKPILRPLSDLTKEIEHNGEKFVPSEKLAFHLFEKSDREYYLNGGINGVPFWVSQKYFEWHFDVFGLIEKGLAINKNDIK